MTNLPLPPGLILILGAVLIPFLKGRAKSIYVVVLPVIGFVNVLALAAGYSGAEEVTKWTVSFLDYELVFGRIDKFSLLFGHIFSLLTVIAFIYILHTKDDLEYMSGMVYAGSGLGVVFAGDLLSLFIFWELLTVCAVGCTLARRTDRARAAAFRYLLVHVVGGLILLAGIVMYIVEHKTAALPEGGFGIAKIGLDSTAGWLIFLGFGVNCAWPFLHAWLPDTYPEASIGGVVFMATFTTKTAVYVLARNYWQEPILMWIGVCMAAFPIFFAVIENDLRKVLSYSLINQVGFMVVGIGIGTHLSLNGTGAHAYCHILYKALLFMSVGAVMYRTGKSKCTELGGLVKSMPLTCLFCVVGAAAISAFPFFSGFVSKSMVMSAAGEGHHIIVWLVLLFASAGVLHHAGIKIPFFAFFSHDSGIRVKEAPTNMLVAMAIAAFLCISISFPVGAIASSVPFIGETHLAPLLTGAPWVGYEYLYGLLPFELETPYAPYTTAHVIGQLLLLMFAALAFALMLLGGKDPPERRATNLDADWIYRRGGPVVLGAVDRSLNGLNRFVKQLVVDGFVRRLAAIAALGPTWLAAQAMLTVWEMQGLDKETIDLKHVEFYRRARAGVFPIGLTACLAVALMALLFIL
ncbi:MAG: multicomponent Na+:H+ antiporter subunit D [Candidatus Binatia bacterium]|jgi:multicomponent Na+:H+ antiporter subunit D